MQWWCAATGRPWDGSWSAYPGVWLFVGALVVGYVLALRTDAAGPVSPWRKGCFAAGLLMVWAALDWPLGPLGAGYLASAHMVQFLLIALAAPPLLLLGLPPMALEAVFASRGIGPPLERITHPVVALALFLALMGITHWPPVVDGLMPAQLGSLALDLAWLGGGILFWLPVVAPIAVRPWFGLPLRIGYLIAATILNTGVFAYLTFSELPLYAIYELAPPVELLDTREDQRLAGLLMKVGGAPILWTAITILFARWYLESRQDESEAR